MIVSCIATRNEQASIGLLVDKLMAVTDRVIISDESDDDRTAKIARHHGAHVIYAPHRTGIGPSLMRAWREAVRLRTDYIIQIDAGWSHDPSEIPLLLAEGADICIGSRFLPGSTYHGRPWRATLSRAYAGLQNWQTGLHLTDWTSGFRAVEASVARDLLTYSYEATMHGWQAEVLYRALDLHCDITEVPITYHAGGSSLTWHHAIEAVRVR